MEAPIAEKKMGDSELEGVGALQVSVSFGRFADDSLSWEKWSTFPTNKYLDEVEKCSTAGSVAQKKAFFEAHYKNVAARKADQEGQDKKRGLKESDPMHLEDRTCRDSMSDSNAVKVELDVDKSNGPYVNEIEIETKVPNSTVEIHSCRADESKDVDTICESKEAKLLSEDVDESSCRCSSPELHKSEESVLVRVVEESPHLIADTRESAPKDKAEKVKSEKSSDSQKATTVKKATNTGLLKKKPTSSIPNASVILTPKLSRPTLSKSINSESKALSKKKNGTSPLTSKKPNRVETRRAAPTSLRMSLDLDPVNSEPALSTTMRKSLFMEKMGDKDIVKRAFKAFQNNFNQLSSSSPAKPAAASEIPGKVTDIKASLVGTPAQKIEGCRETKLVKKSVHPGGQPGPRRTSNSTRVPNTVIADQRNSKSVPSPYSLRSHEKPATGNKILKKLQERVDSRAAGRTQLQCKDKNGAELKKLQHSHHTKAKAKPISDTVMLKSSLSKDVEE